MSLSPFAELVKLSGPVRALAGSRERLGEAGGAGWVVRRSPSGPGVSGEAEGRGRQYFWNPTAWLHMP